MFGRQLSGHDHHSADEHKRVEQWRQAVVRGDWARALDLAQDPAIDGQALVGFDYLTAHDGPAERHWFERCREEATTLRLIELLDRHSRREARAGNPAPSEAAVVFALGAGNEGALRALKAKRPSLFTSVAIERGVAQMVRATEGRPPEEAPALMRRLESVAQWDPEGRFDAKDWVAQMADASVAASRVFAVCSTTFEMRASAPCLRLALDAGLDPNGKALMFDSEAVALPLVALHCQDLHPFFELVRRGADLHGTKLPPRDGGGKAAGWPNGLMGLPWTCFEWPRGLAPEDDSPFMDGGAKRAPVRAGISAHELVSAGLDAVMKLGPKQDAEAWARRRAQWRAEWEALTLDGVASETIRAKGSDSAENGGGRSEKRL
jgi:hypothetical protein